MQFKTHDEKLAFTADKSLILLLKKLNNELSKILFSVMKQTFVAATGVEPATIRL